jgi:peptide/nickel transport system ATP-binding protein
MTMIFQEPMTSLNPIFKIGDQLDEVQFLHIPGISKEDAKKKTIEMLELVVLLCHKHLRQLSHELSGG